MELNRNQQLIIFILIGAILFGGGYRLAQHRERAVAESQPVLERNVTAEEKKSKDIFVHVTGAVLKPGVYQLPQGSRVIDGLKRAEPSGEACTDQLKLASPLVDGQSIYVPSKSDVARAGSAAVISQAGANMAGINPANRMVNINLADERELDTLPGIGPALARRIIQYRETNGPFMSTDELKAVSGIGDKKYEGLKDLVTVW